MSGEGKGRSNDEQPAGDAPQQSAAQGRPAVPAPRRAGVVRKVLAGVFGVLALLALSAFVTRTFVSDRYEAFQIVAWPPAWMFLGPAIVLGAIGRLAAIRTSSRLQSLTSLAAAVPLAVLLLGPWRVTNALSRGEPSGSLVVMSWNAAPSSHPLLDEYSELIPQMVAQGKPDVFIVTNPNWLRMKNLVGELAGMQLVSVGGSDIATDLPVLRRGPVPMPDTEGRGSPRLDYIVLDTSERSPGSETLTIWSIDLPSNRGLWRDELARMIAGAIDEVRSRGWEEQTPPAPDLIMGDLNIPRGSASLRHFVQGLDNAHTVAGLGPSATWPRETPVLHIDQTFVGNNWTATKYDVVDPGAGVHRAQRVVVTPKPN